MPRDTLVRIKPHMLTRLQSLGFSSIAAQQLASSQPLTNPVDRARLNKILGALVEDAKFPLFHQALTTNDTINK